MSTRRHILIQSLRLIQWDKGSLFALNKTCGCQGGLTVRLLLLRLRIGREWDEML
jgi:hypothetical protein